MPSPRWNVWKRTKTLYTSSVTKNLQSGKFQSAGRRGIQGAIRGVSDFWPFRSFPGITRNCGI
jgi:hypothetical protein